MYRHRCEDCTCTNVLCVLRVCLECIIKRTEYRSTGWRRLIPTPTTLNRTWDPLTKFVLDTKDIAPPTTTVCPQSSSLPSLLHHPVIVHNSSVTADSSSSSMSKTKSSSSLCCSSSSIQSPPSSNIRRRRRMLDTRPSQCCWSTSGHRTCISGRSPLVILCVILCFMQQIVLPVQAQFAEMLPPPSTTTPADPYGPLREKESKSSFLSWPSACVFFSQFINASSVTRTLYCVQD